MKKAFLSTLLHTIELVVCLGASLLVVRYFELGSENMAIIMGLVVNAVSKYARASDASPIPDFVNK